MWRPGSAKPEANSGASRNHTKKTNKSGPNNLNLHRNDDVGNDNTATSDDYGSPPLAAAEASSQNTLSGATMNMRFMQRKSQQRKNEKQHYSFRRRQEQHLTSSLRHSTATQAGPTRDLDAIGVDDAARSSAAGTCPVVNTQHYALLREPRQSAHNNAVLVDLTPTTRSDMYGISADVIGRRSFGGFNRPMEEAWKASHRFHRQERQQEEDASRRRGGASR